MNKKQRVALLGCSFIGEVHAANLLAHSAVELVSVADTDSARAGAFATCFAARAAAVSGVMADDSIDMVLLASATPTHADLLEAAARTGKAIYCEKPIYHWTARAARWNGFCALQRAGNGGIQSSL